MVADTMEIKPFKRIYLIRHCKADGQAPGAQLTSEGLQQARKLADFLSVKQIDYIISSSYDRATATIEPLAKKINVKTNTDARLCERILSSEPLPDWEEKLYQTFLDGELRLPGGETSSEATQRDIAVMNDLFELPEKRIAVVTHGNIMCLMLRFYNTKYGFDDWQKLTNPDVFELLKTTMEEDVSINRIWQ